MKVGWQIALLTSPLLLAGLFVGGLFFFSEELAENRQYWNPQPFNSLTWRHPVPISQRQCMLVDLMKRNHQLKGMTRTEVVELLGIPEGGLQDNDTAELQYQIGECGPDALYLRINFENGKVTGTEIRRS